MRDINGVGQEGRLGTHPYARLNQHHGDPTRIMNQTAASHHPGEGGGQFRRGGIPASQTYAHPLAQGLENIPQIIQQNGGVLHHAREHSRRFDQGRLLGTQPYANQGSSNQCPVISMHPLVQTAAAPRSTLATQPHVHSGVQHDHMQAAYNDSGNQKHPPTGIVARSYGSAVPIVNYNTGTSHYASESVSPLDTGTSRSGRPYVQFGTLSHIQNNHMLNDGGARGPPPGRSGIQFNQCATPRR